MSGIARREFLRRSAIIAAGLTVAPERAAAASDDSPCSRLSGEVLIWIVPNAPGGGYDAYSRLIVSYLEEALGADIAVRNLPSAGGLVGARTLLDARPDGGTIGIINGAGLLAAHLAGEERAPNPAAAFTLLGRVATSRQIWATGGASSLRTIDDVLEMGRERPVVFGVRDVGSLSFTNMTLASAVIGLDAEAVPGYLGSAAGVMAAARGDVDLVAYTFGSIRGHLESGEIRPLLQIADAPIATDPLLDGVPLLGGGDGVAARQARCAGRDAETAIADATALVNLLSAGRLIVAPPAMDPALANCLEDALMRSLHDPRLAADARRAGLPLDIATGEEALGALAVATERAARFVPLIAEAIERIRR